MAEPNGLLTTRIHGVLAEHIGGILAGTAIEHCCEQIGVACEDLAQVNLFEFAAVLNKRLMPFVGPEAAAKIADRVRDL